MAALKLDLVIRLLDQATAPVRRLGQLVARLDKPFQAVRAAAGGLWRDIKGIALAGVAMGAALAGALFQSVRNFADAGDAALLASQKIGVSVPWFMRTAYAAGLAGSSTEGLNDALKFLNVSTAAAARGAKQDAQAFDQLGIAYLDAHGRMKPVDQLLPAIADKFATMPDGPTKTAIAMALFGRAGTELIPMLNEGSAGLKKWGDEAEAMGLVMSQKAAEDADAFNDSLDRLKGGIFGLSNGIVGGLLPDLTALIDRTRVMIAANKPAILAKMRQVFTQIAAALPGVIKGVSDFARFLGQIAAVLGPVIVGLGGFGQVLDALAYIMIGRVAIAVWLAVKAVWALNGAMLANPVGIVIALIGIFAALAYMVYRNWGSISAFFSRIWGAVVGYVRRGVATMTQVFLKFHPFGLIIRHWSTIVAFFQGLWTRISAAFKIGIDAVWNILPPWFRQILRGGRFVIQAISGVGRQPPAAPGGGGGRPSAPPGGGLAVGAAARRGAVDVSVRVHQDGRPPTVETSTQTPALATARVGGVTTRGG